MADLWLTPERNQLATFLPAPGASEFWNQKDGDWFSGPENIWKHLKTVWICCWSVFVPPFDVPFTSKINIYRDRDRFVFSQDWSPIRFWSIWCQLLLRPCGKTSSTWWFQEKSKKSPFGVDWSGPSCPSLSLGQMNLHRSKGFLLYHSSLEHSIQVFGTRIFLQLESSHPHLVHQPQGGSPTAFETVNFFLLGRRLAGHWRFPVRNGYVTMVPFFGTEHASLHLSLRDKKAIMEHG